MATISIRSRGARRNSRVANPSPAAAATPPRVGPKITLPAGKLWQVLIVRGSKVEVYEPCLESEVAAALVNSFNADGLHRPSGYSYCYAREVVVVTKRLGRVVRPAGAGRAGAR